MEIIPINSRKEWNDFLLKEKGTFLQSFQWGEFKEKYQKVFRFGLKEKGNLGGICQFFEEKTPFGDYFYIPHGPVAKEERVRKELFLKVGEFGKKKGKIFVKTEPLSDINLGEDSFFRIQPQKTLIAKMEDSAEAMLKRFKKNTRYNIRYAEKKGVVFKEEKSVDSFFKLLEKTKKRQNFKTYSKNYFKELLKVDGSYLLLALHREKVVSGVVVFCFGEVVNFLHSASDYGKRDLKAPVFLRFKAMEFAKEKGCSRYDFWGIDEKNFPGVTAYKKGFMGKEHLYPEGKDIPLRQLNYNLYKFLKKIKG